MVGQEKLIVYLNVTNCMKKILLNTGLCLALGMSVALSLSSCEDWTDVESLDINSPSLEEQNPQLYEDYLKDLNAYKASDHKIVMVSVENTLDPVKQAERLSVLPDSIDYVCLNNPDGLSVGAMEEIGKARRKGIKVVYKIDFDELENNWKEMVKANPALAEEDALSYFSSSLKEQISLVDKYNYDGVVANYTGSSLVSMTPDRLDIYKNRQSTLLDVLKTLKTKSQKSLIFYTNVQYLVPENLSFTSICDYVMLKTALSSNGDDMAVKALLAVQAGNDVKDDMYEGVNPVPNDRFIVCVQLPKAGDKDKIIGYWNTLDAAGNKVLAAQGAAWWCVQSSTDYVRKGVFVMDVQGDYYNNTFASIREVINIMNPSK